MWRFKTEKEFIKQYGQKWRDVVNRKWHNEGGMDHLLGWTPKEIDQPFIEEIMFNKLDENGKEITPENVIVTHEPSV